MRKFEPFWIELKEKGQLSIIEDREKHSYWVEGIRAESRRDYTFRFKCIEKGKSYTVRFNHLGNELIFVLSYSSTIPQFFIPTPEKIARQRKWRKNTYIRKHK